MKLTTTSIDALSLATQELWAIAPGYAASADNRLRTPPRKSSPGVVGVVELLGTMTKEQTVPLRTKIAQLAADDAVGEIVIIVDSPGGTVAGTADLNAVISRAAQKKRVTAVVEDMACSGAIYAIAGASEIVLGETAVTGSIGVFNVHIDQSKLMERIGVEVIVVRSGEHKGAGFSGAKLTSDQHAELKRRVDVQARHFTAAIARGRKISTDKAADLADGRVFIGREAIAAGLADRIGLVEDVLAEAGQRSEIYAIENLTGKAAAKKFAELVEIETTKAGGNKYRGEVAVENDFPKLAIAAKAYVPKADYDGRPLDRRWEPQ